MGNSDPRAVCFAAVIGVMDWWRILEAAESGYPYAQYLMATQTAQQAMVSWLEKSIAQGEFIQFVLYCFALIGP